MKISTGFKAFMCADRGQQKQGEREVWPYLCFLILIYMTLSQDSRSKVTICHQASIPVFHLGVNTGSPVLLFSVPGVILEDIVLGRKLQFGIWSWFLEIVLG